MKVISLLYFDPDTDKGMLDMLIDRKYEIEGIPETFIATHISIMFKKL